MKFFERLEKVQKEKNSLVCVGLDADIEKIPKHLLSEADPIFAFNKAIIDGTRDFACCYKLNIAFYEAAGKNGLESLRKTVEYLHSLGEIVIIDAKRNDIGNTAEAYAKGVFDDFGFDACTVNPYMGKDSIEPFLAYADKGIIILVKTSNPGSNDFQTLQVGDKKVYEIVAEKCLEWDKNENVGFVIGATAPAELENIRKMAPITTFLIPGVGAQGGDIEATLKAGLRNDGLGVIINSSRGVIYASNGEDFAEKAREATIQLRDEINKNR